jgi:hypothetical protein
MGEYRLLAGAIGARRRHPQAPDCLAAIGELAAHLRLVRLAPLFALLAGRTHSAPGLG